MNKITKIKSAFLFSAAVPFITVISRTYNQEQILKELQLKDKSTDQKLRIITQELEEQKIKLNGLERELQKQSKEKNQTQQETPNKNTEIDIRNGKKKCEKCGEYHL